MPSFLIPSQSVYDSYCQKKSAERVIVECDESARLWDSNLTQNQFYFSMVLDQDIHTSLLRSLLRDVVNGAGKPSVKNNPDFDIESQVFVMYSQEHPAKAFTTDEYNSEDFVRAVC